MTITLEVVDGPGRGRKIFLQPGERVTVGRTEEAQHCFAENGEMSSLHFALICEWSSCFVNDLNSTNGTFLNGKRVIYSELSHGDRLEAGQSVFHVVLSGAEHPLRDDIPAGDETADPVEVEIVESPAAAAVAESPAGPPQLVPVRDEPPGFISATVSELCANIKDLDDAARDLVNQDQSPRQYLAALEEQEFFTDAIRFLAHALARRDAVAWATDCVQSAGGDHLTEKDSIALNVTRSWVADPSEANRRAAMAAAEELEHKTPASWAAMGAFFSEGSMGPPNVPAIPPGPQLTAGAVAGAVMLAAVANAPERAAEKYQDFIQLGIKQGEPVSVPDGG